MTKDDDLKQSLSDIQDYLYQVSSYIASQGNKKYLHKESYELILEQQIDQMDLKLPKLKNFIHPGGCTEASHLHYARALSRKVERNYISYARENNSNAQLVKFFNRLSDFLFTAARYMNMINKVGDVSVK